MNSMMVRNFLAVGLLSATAWTLGCGQGSSVDHPTTYPVTGTVTYEGAPVEGATVTFRPTTGNQAAFGNTDASGKYSLTTFVSGDGALPGDYKVKIAKYEVQESTSSGEGDDYVPPEELPEGASTGPKNLLPEKYNNDATSGLTATVTEGDNMVDFKLE